MSYLFPFAFILNTFAMTGLMIGVGMAGQSSLAADIGIVQGATLALFYAFSANARSMILNPTARLTARSILVARLLLVGPLGAMAFYLSVYVAEVEWILAFALILRRSVEWVTEVHLSEMERHGNKTFAKKFSALQAILFFLLLGWMFVDASSAVLGMILWALLPLIMSIKFVEKTVAQADYSLEAWQQMLPHLGSTAVIGITVYVFRLLLLLLVDKDTAGDLYTAFAIGGLMGSVFAQALGPSLALHEGNHVKAYLPIHIRVPIYISLLAGMSLFAASTLEMHGLEWTGKSLFFWGATGLSLIGGVVMVYAQRIRIRLLQQHKDRDVFGPDVLMNIIIVACVPYIYYLLGKEALIALYFINATLAFLFYFSTEQEITSSKNRLGMSVETIKKAIAFLLLFPLFFQLGGGIFNDPAMVFDSGGSLFRLPIPVSVLACYGGVLLLSQYKQAHLSLVVIFLSFLLMLLSTVVLAHNQDVDEEAKLILLIQFILPMFALVLGQVYVTKQEKGISFEKVLLYVLAALVPLQLFLSRVQGWKFLSPYFYIFSIYQHLQYVPPIFVSCYLLSLYTLWDRQTYRKILIILAPLMGIYVVASLSILAILLLLTGILFLAVYRWRLYSDKWLTVVFVIVVLTAGSYMIFAKNEPPFELSFLVTDGSEDRMPNLSNRMEYWKYYGTSVFSSPKTFFLGHIGRPDRNMYPSAHNYYLDFVYNFGFIALVPILAAIGFTLWLVYRCRQKIFSAPSLLGLTGVVIFLLLADNSLKVGMRQPYPGIMTFFLWGLLLARIESLRTGDKRRLSATGEL